MIVSTDTIIIVLVQVMSMSKLLRMASLSGSMRHDIEPARIRDVWCAPYFADKVPKIDAASGTSTQLADNTYSGSAKCRHCVGVGIDVRCAP